MEIKRVKGGDGDEVTDEYWWKLTWKILCIPEVGESTQILNGLNWNGWKLK